MALFVVVLPLLGFLSACGGVTTSATVDQPVGSLSLAADTSTGAADGYVYIPVTSSRLLPEEIVISSDPTPPASHVRAVGATVEIQPSPTAQTNSLADTGRIIIICRTNSLGYYALLRLTPGAYDLAVTIDGGASRSVQRTVQITIEEDSTTHATELPSPDHPFAGFTCKHIDLSGNTIWQEFQDQDRIESIDDIQFSFSATNESGAPATLDVFISQNGSFTAVTIDDDNPDDPVGYHVYSFSLPAGGPILISSNADNTIEENLQEFKDQVLSGDFYLYARVTPPQGGSFIISNVELRLRIRLRVL